jgi:hypothetical protein
MTTLRPGGYCLATKFYDGEGWDAWGVGFYEGEIFPGRHSILGTDGKRIRNNGFRRCERITDAIGAYLLENVKAFETTGARLWHCVEMLCRTGRPPMVSDCIYLAIRDAREQGLRVTKVAVTQATHYTLQLQCVAARIVKPGVLSDIDLGEIFGVPCEVDATVAPRRFRLETHD